MVTFYDAGPSTNLGSMAHMEMHRSLEAMLPVLEAQFPNKYVAKIIPTKAKMNGQEAPDPNGFSQWFYMTDGISFQLKIMHMSTNMPVLNVQLITNNIINTEYESWAQCVINQFNITSARVAFTSAYSLPIFGSDAVNDILHSEFQYLSNLVCRSRDVGLI